MGAIGGMARVGAIQSSMKQPTDQRERNEDKKKPEENPSRGIDPESQEEEMEVADQDPGSPTRAFFARGGVEDPGERQKENQNQKKDDDLAA